MLKKEKIFNELNKNDLGERHKCFLIDKDICF